MNRTRYTTLAEINVTSLVDVSLVLLIIFMITAPLLQSGLEVNLPQADADELQAKEGIVVVITAGGALYIEQELVERDSFGERLMQHYASRGGQPVLLKADREVPYGEVIRVIDRIKRSGISKVGLLVEPGVEQ